VKLLKKFQKEDCKYAANEASCNNIIVFGKFSNAEFSREFMIVFDIGYHPTLVTCLTIAAESFK